ncbi:Tk.4 conserved hypothetical protein [Aeromonas phage phiAS5]|uniref:Macro domain-containing protein n=1 Tax=Aeromonas phage phiAS5 TaxID=879630 RepID=E1A2G7_9CAUD|nr:Tk.4 conserved hypothetical protein [Aeromonas phage phiAS5]ADM79913.1 Tk.4 conserved hypothetical protein [Aeromonas phage phiAS5]BES53317.1 hypothetical protein [Aeromonas phage phiWae14]
MISFQEANLIDVIKGMIARKTTDTNKIYIAHGCNCFAAMGAGFAAQVARHFPAAEKADRLYAKEFKTEVDKETHQLGTLSAAEIGHGTVMFNLYSQLYPGADFRLDAFERAFDDMMLRLEEAHNTEDVKPLVLMPRIGAGIGGGKWEEILEVIKNYENVADIIVFDYKPLVIVSSCKTHYEDHSPFVSTKAEDVDLARYMVEDVEQD